MENTLLYPLQTVVPDQYGDLLKVRASIRWESGEFFGWHVNRGFDAAPDFYPASPPPSPAPFVRGPIIYQRPKVLTRRGGFPSAPFCESMPSASI
jgi:hypothetical protein